MPVSDDYRDFVLEQLEGIGLQRPAPPHQPCFGSMATLTEVVEFYDRGGRTNPDLDPEIRPLGLTPHEREALVAFLQALSGEIREGAS